MGALMHIRRGIFTLIGTTVAALSLTACQPQTIIDERLDDVAAGHVRFEMAGPHDSAILVPVVVNGEGPFDFILDTGATLTCVDRGLASELALPEQEGVEAMVAGVKGSGRVDMLTIDDIQVGSARGSNLTVCGLDLEAMRRLGVNARGLLGLNFLREFRMMIDFDAKVVQLEHATATEAGYIMP
jgi:predicted aspartyl protease